MHEAETTALREELARLRDTRGETKDKLQLLLSKKEQEEAERRKVLEEGHHLLTEMQQQREEFQSRMKMLEEKQEQQKMELMHELDATGDAFMPKSVLTKILNQQAAQIDELRRLIVKPQVVEKRRVWDDNVQMFVEVAATAAPTPRQVESSSLQKLEHTFKHDEKQARTRLDLELELAATTREYRALENDVSQLRSLRESLSAAQVEAEKSDEYEGEHHSRGKQSKAVSSEPAAGQSQQTRKEMFGQLKQLTLSDDGDASDASSLNASQVSLTDVRTPKSILKKPVEPTKSRRHVAVSDAIATPSSYASSPHKLVPNNLTIVGTLPVTPRTDIVIEHRSKTPTDEITADVKLEGEDWMFDPKLQRLLSVKEAARERVSRLRFESQKKILHLRKTQKQEPGVMSFHDKMAFFTTTQIKVHDEIARQAAMAETDTTKSAPLNSSVVRLSPPLEMDA